MALRLRRGTEAERQLIIPENGELIYATDTKLVYVGDGTTQGGNPISVGAALLEVVNDTSPQLGGDLELNDFDITGTGNINISGAITTNNVTLDTLASNTAAGILLSNDIDLNSSSIIGPGAIDINGTVTATEVSTDTLSSDSAIAILLDDPLDLNGNNIIGVGNINIDGTITATGNINLGDGSEDNISVSGQISSNLIPDVTTTYNIGSPTLAWDTGYFSDLEALGTVNTTDLIVTRIFADDSSVIFDGTTGTLAVDQVDALTVNASQFIGDLAGSVFADDSTLFFDAINNAITVESGEIDRASINDISSTTGLLSIGADASTRVELNYDGSDSILRSYSLSINNAPMELNVSRGSLEVPEAVGPGDPVQGIVFNGYTGSVYGRTTAIRSFVDSEGTVGANSISGSFVIINTNAQANGVVIAEFDTHGVFKVPVLATSVYADTTARDNKTGIQAGSIVLVNDDGTGSTQFQGYDGTEWKALGPNDETNVVSATTAFTLSLSDSYKYHRISNASAVTVTVPPNSSVAFPIGTTLTVVQAGAGQVTFAAGAGVTINSADSLLSTRVQFSSATITKVSADEWDLIGDLA